MDGDRITASLTAESVGNLSEDSLTAVLRDALATLDLPTPSVRATHVSHLKNFNVTRFLPADFVESVDFTSMTVESLLTGKEKRPHKRNPLDEA